MKRIAVAAVAMIIIVMMTLMAAAIMPPKQPAPPPTPIDVPVFSGIGMVVLIVSLMGIGGTVIIRRRTK